MWIRTRAARGFTLLEVMIASAIGLIVLGAGLVAAMQMQRRSQFEEQTMQAQTTGRVVMELLAADLQRAGTGMGNAPITFSDTRIQTPIQVWTEADLSAADVTRPFLADANFALPPPGHLEEFRSDVLQIHWGDTRGMVTMAPCGGGNSGPTRSGPQGFCTTANPSTRLQPLTAPSTPAFVVNPGANFACHVRVTNVDTGGLSVTADPGFGTEATTTGRCATPNDGAWNLDTQAPERTTWRIMQAQSAAYRVNWASGTPTLEYLGPDAVDWVVLSRHVEQLKVRFGVMSHVPPLGFRWFPDEAAGLPAIDACTTTTCPIDQHPDASLEAGPPADDEELRRRLRQRIREVEVKLVVRTPRPDRDAFDPAEPIRLDKEDFPIDGFKRRTYTFRAMLRNFAAGGLQPPLVGE